MLRVVLDINVWVANYLASARGRDGTSCQLLVESIIVGNCRLGPLVSGISHTMLDTFQAVLERDLNIPADIADAARGIAQEACSFPPLAVLGGGFQPMKEFEDMGVLETVVAARANLLVTCNLKDFIPGPKSQIAADVVRSDNGKADILLVRHPSLPMGLVIATPFAAKAWLIDGIPPPPGILEQFQPGKIA
jgi:predicted nucleic acid-binding protein